MQNKMLKPRILSFFACLSLAACVYQTARLHLIRGMDNYTCIPDERSFSSKLRSLLDCSVMCVKSENCESVFYITDTGFCHGCLRQYNSSDITNGVLQTLSGSEYMIVSFHHQYEMKFGNSVYFLTETSQRFEDGILGCSKMGGNAVAIETEEENTYLRNILTELGLTNLVFIGLQQPAGPNTPWIWNATGQEMTFNGFNPTEPNAAHELCVLMFGGYGFKWADFECTAVNKMLCEINLLMI